MDFLEFINLPTTHRKYGTERTPGGSPRYLFWFGVSENGFTAYKFKTYRNLNQSPACVFVSFSLSDFVETAKHLGLHISKAERTHLQKEKFLEWAKDT